MAEDPRAPVLDQRRDALGASGAARGVQRADRLAADEGGRAGRLDNSLGPTCFQEGGEGAGVPRVRGQVDGLRPVLVGKNRAEAVR